MLCNWFMAAHEVKTAPDALSQQTCQFSLGHAHPDLRSYSSTKLRHQGISQSACRIPAVPTATRHSQAAGFPTKRTRLCSSGCALVTWGPGMQCLFSDDHRLGCCCCWVLSAY